MFFKYNIGIIEENWRVSQFWYSPETALYLAEDALAAAGEGGRIACVSAPRVYQKLRDASTVNRAPGGKLASQSKNR